MNSEKSTANRNERGKKCKFFLARKNDYTLWLTGGRDGTNR